MLETVRSRIAIRQMYTLYDYWASLIIYRQHIRHADDALTWLGGFICVRRQLQYYRLIEAFAISEQCRAEIHNCFAACNNGERVAVTVLLKCFNEACNAHLIHTRATTPVATLMRHKALDDHKYIPSYIPTQNI